MPKIPALKPSRVIKVLRQAGFEFIRQKGSHRIYNYKDKFVTIPYHNKDLKKGTLKAIIKQSGLTLEKFLDLL